MPLLKGKARTAYVAMTFDDSQDYVKVKQAILDKFNIKAETYRQRFRSKTILEDETAKELQARLKDLFAKWIAPETLTKDQICDQMVLEQFLGMLNTDLQVWVREHTPRSSAEAADLVETFVTARPSRRKYFLGPPQHDWRRPYQAAQQEPEKTSTGKPAGDSGRVVKLSYSPNSPSVSSTPARTPRGMICHGCGQQGHIRPNCTEKKMSDSRLCYLPGPNKHTHMTCADVIVPVKVKGKTL